VKKEKVFRKRVGEVKIMPFERGHEIKFDRLAEEMRVTANEILDLKAARKELESGIISEKSGYGDAAALGIKILELEEKLKSIGMQIGEVLSALEAYKARTRSANNGTDASE
jgi:hypothetical protein